MATNDTQISVLHDHYKDSFQHIRDREKQRDRLFLLVVALIGLLFIEIGYPEGLQHILGPIGAAGAKVNLNELPVSAILSTTWVFLLVISLRHCQISITVERQYTYLHGLEKRISLEIGATDAIAREGRAYKDNSPAFTSFAWFFYTVVFPIMVIASSAFLAYSEWSNLALPWYHKYFDCLIAFGIITTQTLYKVWPMCIDICRWLKKTWNESV